MVNLRDLREVLRWDQADAAYVLGISQRAVSRLEAGENVHLTDEQEVKLARMQRLADRKLADRGVDA